MKNKQKKLKLNVGEVCQLEILGKKGINVVYLGTKLHKGKKQDDFAYREQDVNRIVKISLFNEEIVDKTKIVSRFGYEINYCYGNLPINRREYEKLEKIISGAGL